MKKWILALGTMVALSGFAQDANTAPRKIIETVNNTTYIGKALATRSGGSPSTNAAVWSIKRIVDDGTTVDVSNAFNTNAAGDQTIQNVWATRAAATYK